MTRPDLATLEEIQRRVLWLAVRMVDHANRERPPGEIKVGGHQASSASMVGIMTALWFGHLGRADKVAVKPHASPVYHAIKYLTGELDRSSLTRLRALGGLQAYPSRTKDPDVVDFSTGSVGLGDVAPLFAAATRRYLDAHAGAASPPARFIALAGDAELDEGNVWEAITDPALQGLGNVMLVVDTNRQSLDRVVPGQKIKKLMEFFDGAGWHVVEAKYGRRLQDAFARPGGDALRAHIEAMSNEEYQSLFACRGAALRERFCAHADDAVRRLVDDVPDDELAPLVHNLGGHDLDVLLEAYRACDATPDRPSVVFAYTVKGWGLPIAGDPLNHSALLTAEQIDELRAAVGLTPETEWDRFEPDSPAGRVCRATGGELNNVPVPPRPVLPIPAATGVPAAGRTSTQEAFGRALTRLADVPGVAERLVTTSPDVSVSTNLGGWINKVGVFAPTEEADDACTRVHGSWSSGRRRGSRWRRRAVRTSRRSRRRSGSSCRASRTPNLPPPGPSTGCCATGWPTSPGPLAPRCTCACRRARSTRRRSPGRWNGSARSGCAPTCSPPPTCSTTRACRRSSSTSRPRTGCSAGGGDRCATLPATDDRPSRTTTWRRSSRRPNGTCRS
jgi:pyruvate dehydrogenase E1 component